jgi:hypothetical protein
MVDYKVDKNFNLVRTKYGNLEQVFAKEEFQQELAIKLAEKEDEIIGRTRDNAAVSKINLIVKRVAQEFDEIDGISNISVNKDKTALDSYRVNIRYDTGETFEETI